MDTLAISDRFIYNLMSTASLAVQTVVPGTLMALVTGNALQPLGSATIPPTSEHNKCYIILQYKTVFLVQFPCRLLECRFTVQYNPIT